jgi:hypothetical protein
MDDAKQNNSIQSSLESGRSGSGRSEEASKQRLDITTQGKRREGYSS